MKKYKSFLAMLMAAAMFSLTACGNGGTSPEPDSTASQEESTTAGAETRNTAAEEESENGSTEVNDDTYTVKIVCVGDATTEACDAVAEAVSAITIPKYNIKVELVRLSYGSFSQEVNLMLTSGEDFDLMPSFAFSTMTAANSGQILELNDLLNEYGQDILTSIPDGEWNCVTFDGSIYAVPNNKEKAQGFGIAMRSDMLEAVDYDLDSIQTEADLTGLFEAIKEVYPNTYPLVADNGQMGYNMVARDELGGDFGILLDIFNEDSTEVENWYGSDAYRELVELHYQWAQDGLIMPDASTSTENAYDLIAADKGFAYFTNTKPGINAEWTRKVGKDMTVLEIVAPFKTTSGVSNQWYIAHNSQQPGKAMQILNEMYTNPEVSELLINGIEGEHYLHDETANVLIYPEGVDVSNTTYSSVAWVWPNELITTPWEIDGPDVWEETLAFNESAADSVALGFVWDNSAVLNEITACTNVTAKYADALICGSLDPETALEKMNNELEEAGLSRIIAEKQRQLDEWRAQ